MADLNVILELTIILMLGAMLVFQLGKWSSESKSRSSAQKPSPTLDATAIVDSSGELLRTLERIEGRLRELTTRSSLDLPWTDFIHEEINPRELVLKLNKQRERRKLSMMDELEFHSCAQLASLSFLTRTPRREGRGGQRRDGIFAFPRAKNAD